MAGAGDSVAGSGGGVTGAGDSTAGAGVGVTGDFEDSEGVFEDSESVGTGPAKLCSADAATMTVAQNAVAAHRNTEKRSLIGFRRT